MSIPTGEGNMGTITVRAMTGNVYKDGLWAHVNDPRVPSGRSQIWIPRAAVCPSVWEAMQEPDRYGAKMGMSMPYRTVTLNITLVVRVESVVEHKFKNEEGVKT